MFTFVYKKTKPAITLQASYIISGSKGRPSVFDLSRGGFDQRCSGTTRKIVKPAPAGATDQPKMILITGKRSHKLNNPFILPESQSNVTPTKSENLPV